MSLKGHKNLVIVGGVAVALLVGTVLLGSYANVQPAVNKTCPQVNAQTAAAGTCPMAKTAFDASTCPAGRTEACCAEEGQASECGKPCPADCDKPCCADEAVAGCPMQSQSSGCCPTQTDAAAQ
ncbi:MAG: hypothetical protein ABIF19_17210 [Planctomycetota bacterium]